MGYTGVDVAKAALQVADSRGVRQGCFANSPEGIERFLHWLRGGGELEPPRLIIEPAGAYRHPLIAALSQAGVSYTRVNPAQTAAFARVPGKGAKTGPVDARLPASLPAVRGESRQPEPKPPAAGGAGEPQGPGAPPGLGRSGNCGRPATAGKRRVKGRHSEGAGGGGPQPLGSGPFLPLAPPAGIGQPGTRHRAIDPGD